MSFPGYVDHRDSGISWVGKLPKHWTIEPLKYSFKIVGGSTPKSDVPEYWDGGLPWVTPADLSKLDGWDIFGTQRMLTIEGLRACSASLVPTGSVVLSTRAPIGSLGITVRDACTNQGCKSLVPNGRFSAHLLAYLFSAVTEELQLRGKGTTFMELSTDELSAFRIPVPPLPEQTAIAVFLDRETAKIDALVEEQRQLIKLLKEKRQAVISHAVTKGLDPTVPMKDSGVEWLGNIPAHWTVAPVRARYEVQLGRMLNDIRSRGVHLRPYLRVFDVQWGKISVSDLPEMDFPPDAQERYRLASGDLIVNEGGSYVGRSAIWRGDLEECYYQKSLHRLRPRHYATDSADFFYYVMEMATKAGVFKAQGNQTTIDHLTADQLRATRFAFPPLSEQRQLADRLEVSLSKFALLVHEAERGIAILQERGAALISAAVTGKIDVNSIAFERAEAA